MNNGLETALRVAQVGDLPVAIDESYKKQWLKAIVKIQRSNGEVGYCLAVNDGNNQPRIIRDFCPSGIIRGIISVHPYEEASANIVPYFVNDAQIIQYLCKSDFERSEVETLLNMEGKTPEQIKADRETLKGYIMQVALKHEKYKEETLKRGREILAVADPKRKEKKAKERKYGRTATTKAKRGKDKD